MPITMVTANGTIPTATTDPNAHIAAWAATLRQLVTVRQSPNDPVNFGDYVQVDRVGNPLTVELLIPAAHEGLLESQQSRVTISSSRSSSPTRSS